MSEYIGYFCVKHQHVTPNATFCTLCDDEFVDPSVDPVKDVIDELTSPPMRVLEGQAQPPQGDIEPPTRTAQIIRWRGITRLDIPVERILEAAGGAGLRVAVVIGYDAEGDEYFAASVADGADVVWLLERAKHKLITGDFD